MPLESVAGGPFGFRMEPLNVQSSVPVRRPLVGAALFFVTGLAVARIWPCAPVGGCLLAAAAAVGAALAMRRTRASAPLLHAAVLLAGFIHGALAAPGRSPLDVRRLLTRPREQVESVVRVVGAPSALPQVREDRAVWTFEGRIEAVRHATPGWRTASGTARVRLSMSPSSSPPAYGDRWRLGAVCNVDPVRGDLAMDAVADASVRLDTGGGNAPMRWCYARREASRRLLERGVEDWPKSSGVVTALVLGYREDISVDIREAFMRTGTAHIFAISGLHVAILALVLLAALRTFGLPRPLWALGLIPLLTLYTLATGAASSAVRALLMASAYWAAPLVRRRPDALSALALAALAILGAAPDQLTDAGFLFSFTAVAGLIVLAPVLQRPMGAWIPPRDSDDTVSRPARAARAAARWGVSLVSTSLAAWLVSTPLTAYFGNQISPAALPGNLLVVPGSFAIVLTGCLSLVAGQIWGAAAEVFNHANAAFCTVMAEFVDSLFRAPGSHAFVQAPPGWALALMYGAIGGLLVLRGRPRAVLAGAVAAVAVAGAARYATDDRVRVILPPADLAPAVLVDAPGGDDLLIDPGPAWKSARTIRWLRSRGVDRLGGLVLTAADASHAGAAPEIVARMPVGTIRRTADPGRSSVVRAMLKEWAATGRQVVALSAGEGGPLPGGAAWDVLFPGAGFVGERAADSALVLRIGRGRQAVLLAGSAGAAACGALQNGPVEPGATVVVADREPGVGDTGWLAATFAKRLILRPSPDGFHDSFGADSRLFPGLRIERPEEGIEIELY
jgi:competence protein ComEC